MRGLMLNDLYNIGHNAKQILLIVVVWGICFAGSSDTGSYLVMFPVLFCMMTATTFSFDEKCGWTKYAMVFPVTRRDYVLEKYLVNFLFSLAGTLIGVALTLAANAVRGKEMDGSLGIYAMIGICIGLLVGGVFIPLLFRFGAEKARLILVAAVLIPVGIYVLLQHLLEEMDIVLTQQMIEDMIYVLPVGAVILSVVTFFISVHIFSGKEF